MSKKPKKKKIKLTPAFWICLVAIILIVVLLNVKNKRKNQTNNANGFSGPAFANSDTTAVGYVKEHYLKYQLIEDIMGGATKENKMKYVIDLMNNEAGTRQKEISEEAVKAKYKEVFAEDLELEDKIIMTPNEYKHESAGGNFVLDTNEEISENQSAPAQEEKEQVTLEPRDTTHKLLITGATTNGDSTIVNIKVANIKTAYEILTIAQAHSDQYDVKK